MKNLFILLRGNTRRCFSSFKIISMTISILAIYWLSIMDRMLNDPFYKSYDVLFLFDFINSTGSFIPLMSIVFILPVGTLYCDDYKSGYRRTLMIRVSHLCYYHAQKFAYLLVPFIYSIFGVSLFLISASFNHDWVTVGGMEWQSHVSSYEYGINSGRYYFLSKLIFDKKYLEYFILSLLLIGFAASLWGMLAFCASIWSKNKFISLTFPFILYYTEEIVAYFLDLRLFRLRTLMWGNFNFCSSSIGNTLIAFFIILIMIFLLDILTYFKYKKDYSNEYTT